jgi:hypothetical protein
LVLSRKRLYNDTMMVQCLVCPYCNTQIPQPASVQEGQRIVCPRCQETFPFHASSLVKGSPASAAAETAQSTADSPSWVHPLALTSTAALGASLALKVGLPESNLTQRAFPFMVLLSVGGLVASLWFWFLRKPRNNTQLGLFVLVNMVAVALAVLPFALSTVGFRRSNDPRGIPLPDKQPPVESYKVKPVAPAALTGLGYLPEDCNVAAAIHVAELAEQPIGKKLLAPRRPDAGEAPARPWLIDQGLGWVEKLTGFKPEVLDHVVFGTREEGRISTMILVVRTRKPYDPAAITRAQSPVVPVKYHNKDLYQFTLQLPGAGVFPVGGQGLLWCTDRDTVTLMFNLALNESDKEMLTDTPRRGVQVTPRPLRTFLGERLATGTLFWWAAGEIDRPEMMRSLLPGGLKNAALAKLAQQPRSLAIGLHLQQENAAILGNVECPDRMTAQQLADLLKQQEVSGLGKPKVPDLAPDQARPWVSFQLSGSPESVVQSLTSVRLFLPTGKGK